MSKFDLKIMDNLFWNILWLIRCKIHNKEILSTLSVNRSLAFVEMNYFIFYL